MKKLQSLQRDPVIRFFTITDIALQQRMNRLLRLLGTAFVVGSAVPRLHAQSIEGAFAGVSRLMADHRLSAEKKSAQRQASLAREANILSELAPRVEAAHKEAARLAARFADEPAARTMPPISLWVPGQHRVELVLKNMITPSKPGGVWGYYCGGRTTLSGAWSASCGQGYSVSFPGGSITRALETCGKKSSPQSEPGRQSWLLRSSLAAALENLNDAIDAIEKVKVSPEQERWRGKALPELRALSVNIKDILAAVPRA